MYGTGTYLEAGMEAHKEGMVAGCLEDMLLRLHPVNVLVVCHQFLLYHLQGTEKNTTSHPLISSTSNGTKRSYLMKKKKTRPRKSRDMFFF